MAKVLIVDDEPAYCRSIAIQLSDDGHETESATTAAEAIKIGKRFVPNVLVIDWIIRDSRGGLQLAAEIHGVNPGLRTILMTGFPIEAVEHEVVEGEVVCLVSKPFTLDEISQAVSLAAANGPRGTLE